MSAESHGKAVFEKLRNIPNISKNVYFYMGLVALGRVRKIDGTRGLLPEPYDFFNHNGNILSSVTTAIAASLAVRLGSSERLRRTKTMSAAILGGVAVNALVETRTGLSLPIVPEMFRNSSPDPIDFGYGMFGALIGGGMVLASEPAKEAQENPESSPLETDD